MVTFLETSRFMDFNIKLISHATFPEAFGIGRAGGGRVPLTDTESDLRVLATHSSFDFPVRGFRLLSKCASDRNYKRSLSGRSPQPVVGVPFQRVSGWLQDDQPESSPHSRQFKRKAGDAPLAS
jgi:hypothetical protein